MAETCPKCGTARNKNNTTGVSGMSHPRRTRMNPLTKRFLSQSAVHDLRGEKRPMEPLASAYLAETCTQGVCSRCGESVKVGPDCASSLCWKCTDTLARLQKAGYWGKAKSRRCSCGARLQKRQRLCEKCALKAQRTRQRAYQQQKRVLAREAVYD